jgi:hypothetical protein
MSAEQPLGLATLPLEDPRRPVVRRIKCIQPLAQGQFDALFHNLGFSHAQSSVVFREDLIKRNGDAF